jgi:hypothetical protein
MAAKKRKKKRKKTAPVEKDPLARLAHAIGKMKKAPKNIDVGKLKTAIRSDGFKKANAAAKRRSTD